MMVLGIRADPVRISVIIRSDSEPTPRQLLGTVLAALSQIRGT
jgi:hypothetical protein